ncbi:MAG: hypothetical protein BWK78_05930 [Thiotrichaceae bacterium IS1]|nr:MAG: hypothetical protein BWK78_05930 [Thiotrichaceae bacterium IS1]
MGTNLIEEAYLCGPMSKAWFKQEGKFHILSLDEDDQERIQVSPARAGDIGLLLDGCLEVTEVTEEIKGSENPREQLATLLRSRRHVYDALAFTLNGLNPKLKEKTRTSGIKLAEKLCHTDEVYTFVQQRLLSRPLAKGMDIQKAIELSKESPRMAQLYQNVQALDAAWRAIVPKLEENQQRQEEWLNYLTESKILANWVVAVLAKDNSKLETMKRDCTREGSSFPKTLQLVNQLRQHFSHPETNTSVTPIQMSDIVVTPPKLVFIDAPNDDMEAVKRVQELLNRKGMVFFPPVTTSLGMRHFFKEMEDNLQKCDSVFIPLKKEVPESWLHEHIRHYTSAQTRRRNVSPLQVKIYNPSKRHLNMPQERDLKITQCSNLTECFLI